MRAVRATGDGGVAVIEVEPTVPAHVRDPVRLRVRSAGICGSDLEMLRWGLPATLGHEFAGVLDDGTAVAVQPNAPCGECEFCRAGVDNVCPASNDRVYGVFTDGGLADEVIVDRRDVVPLPGAVDTSVGALVEPTAVALHAAHLAGLHGAAPPDRVLVVGGGSIGLAFVAAARHHGAEVDLAARHPAQREAGERLGAGPPREHHLYAVVVDCAGTQSSLDEALARVRPAGTIVVPGTWFEPVRVGTGVLMKEARIVPSYVYGHHLGIREFEEAVDVLAAHPELANAMVTHRFGLDDAPEAFRVAADRAAGAIKVVLEP